MPLCHWVNVTEYERMAYLFAKSNGVQFKGTVSLNKDLIKAISRIAIFLLNATSRKKNI